MRQEARLAFAGGGPGAGAMSTLRALAPLGTRTSRLVPWLGGGPDPDLVTEDWLAVVKSAAAKTVFSVTQKVDAQPWTGCPAEQDGGLDALLLRLDLHVERDRGVG